MGGDLGTFAKAAAYLSDPLVLAGFVIFVGLLVFRQLLRSGVIPVLQQGQGFRILRLVFSYGFVLGLAIILLGMGLKYRELSTAEQKRAAELLLNELTANATVMAEIEKNTNSLATLGAGLSAILREPRFQVLSGLFPKSNIDPDVDEATLTNLYNERIDWLFSSNLWNDSFQRQRTIEACAAVTRFVERTRSTVESLADTAMVRYPITRTAYDANLGIVRKITVVDLHGLAELYAQMTNVRVLYNRVVAGSLEYMKAIKDFCSQLPPDRSSLSPVLALERLTFRLLPSYTQKIGTMLTAISAQTKILRLATT